MPTAWLGSTITGRCDSAFTTGIAEMSSVFRVYVSNVLMPRSQSTTSAVPAASRYSADKSHSSIVAEGPRFNRTGFPSEPTFFNSSKFCIFRAPIWNISVRSRILSASSGDTTSVTIGIPYISPAAFMYSSPAIPSPWKAYGLVLGLYAPPRSITAPDSRTLAAVSVICSRLSTAQGPAITVIRAPPIFTGPTETMLSSPFVSRETSS